ncbi:MAG: hypothetical protein ABSB19_12545 [Methylomonas sp.]|jgi:hypothetical protein
MKNTIHRLATYTALILISAMPFSMDVVAASGKDDLAAIATADDAEKDLNLIKRRENQER